MNESIGCHACRLDGIAEGASLPIPRPLGRRLRLAILSRLSPRIKRGLRARLNRPRLEAPKVTAAGVPVHPKLQAGDVVRVLSREEIELTLDEWGQLHGCGMMLEMWPYCDTTQRVLKPVTRFVDECENRIRRAKGLVLLEGLMCQGVAESGPCDRSCFYFWREEWLEKIEAPEQA